jgi:hypothetical protein
VGDGSRAESWVEEEKEACEPEPASMLGKLSQQDERREAGDRLQEQLDQTGAFIRQLQVTMVSYTKVSGEFVKLTREAVVLRRQNSDLLLEKDDLVIERDGVAVVNTGLMGQNSELILILESNYHYINFFVIICDFYILLFYIMTRLFRQPDVDL